MDTTKIHTIYYKRQFIERLQKKHTKIGERMKRTSDKCHNQRTAPTTISLTTKLGNITRPKRNRPPQRQRGSRPDKVGCIPERSPDNILGGYLQPKEKEGWERGRDEVMMRAYELNAEHGWMTYVEQKIQLKIQHIGAAGDPIISHRTTAWPPLSRISSEFTEPMPSSLPRSPAALPCGPLLEQAIESDHHPVLKYKTAPMEGSPFNDKIMYAETDFDEDPVYRDTKLGMRCLEYDPFRGCAHPLWRYGKAIVVLMLLTPEAVRERIVANRKLYSIKLSQSRELPVGADSYEEVEKLGWIRLQPGMAVFIRAVKSVEDRGANRNPLEDDIQGWVLNGNDLLMHHSRYDRTVTNRMRTVTAKVLGPEEERTATPPTDAKNPTGGVALERLLCCVSGNASNSQAIQFNLSTEGRCCYSLGYSFERPRAMAHPCRNMKHDGNFTESEDFRKELLHVATEYAGLVMDLAPNDRIDLIENIGTVKHTLPMGHRNNRNFWTGFQANISRPIRNQASGDFQGDLGRAGNIHPDTHDQLGSFTALIVATHTPSFCTTANFHLIELGVFVPMVIETVIVFSGLRLHARAPSMARASLAAIPQHYYSLALVLYLTKELTTPKQVRSQLCSSLSDKKHPDVLVLPPEAYVANRTICAPPANSPGLAALLNHLTAESPEFRYTFTAAGLANEVEVKRISDRTLIDVNSPKLDPTWKANVLKDWDDLMTLQRYYLGGVSMSKQKMPSREQMPIKLKHVPIYTDKLAMLRGARALATGGSTTPQPSTSGTRRWYVTDFVRPVDTIPQTTTNETPVPENQTPNNLGKHSRESDEESQASEASNNTQDLLPGRDDSPSTMESEEHEDSEEHEESEEKAKKKQRKVKKARKSKSKASKDKDSITKQPVVKRDMRARLLDVLDRDYLAQIADRLTTHLHQNANSKAAWYTGQPVDNTTISMNIIDFACQDSATPDLNVALLVPTIISNILKGFTNLQGLELNRLLVRYSVMLGVWKLWVLIEVNFRQLAESTLDDMETSWISPLVIKIRDHYVNRCKNALVLKNTDYVPGIAKDVTFRVPPASRRWLNKEVEPLVINTVLDALGVWLDCPRNVGKTALWHDQGFLIDVLISHSGSNNICFLDETWEAFQNPKQLIGAKQNGAGMTDQWTTLEADMRSRQNRGDVQDGLIKIGKIMQPYIGKAESVHKERST
ncbi:hypothetical protein OE88DRAFT_1640967 [Heliocybe sulcata]|uniref:Uncharacterized protein n=1 Tax=Heliocybe sulcata TaxID=5364 RepID=A0A5C3NK25_9AGAM|nr:hypothetical protein OE88DRAFT_1640967 [Heliocybe sulcata]